MTATTNRDPLPFDAIELLRVDGTEFIRIVGGADPSLSVPTCPDWRLGDLAFHVARAWNHWAAVVTVGITDRNAIRDLPDLERPDEHGVVIDLLYDAHVRLCDALHDADPAQRVWTWTGSTQPIAWVARRMTHETIVHLSDAARTVGLDHLVDPIVAADGIDEWLTWFAAAERAEGEMKVGGTVHLHCTDPGLPDGSGEWFVAAMKEPKATFTREHRKGDAAVRGRAQDILLWLWRRGDDVDVVGDQIVARRFQAFTDLT